ncbi:hypothetical protein [Plasmodium yoelii yoelii]|nr:hypothetical protein [Plasmodium yoelii yoelii]
MSHILM